MKHYVSRFKTPVVVALALVVLLGLVSIAGVSVIEENDSFCATCHLQPERVYVARARAVAQAFGQAREQGLDGEQLWRASRDAASDLAGSHRGAALNCVACHRGDNSLGDRARALALGAGNTLLYVTGRFDPEHSGLANPDLVTRSCLRCHVWQPRLGGVEEGMQNPVTVDAFENHFHFYLFEPEYAQETAVGCLDCHPSHVEVPPIIPYFIDEEEAVIPACEQCHMEVGKGPVDL
jgi:hypothetical protein